VIGDRKKRKKNNIKINKILKKKKINVSREKEK
jgi:hypothetical protein